MVERQELHCHNCGNYVQFDIDMSLNGNHVLACPVCGHEHCRVVTDGKITEDRWDSRNASSTFNVSTITMTSSSTSTFASYNSVTTTSTTTMNTTATFFMYDAWINRGN